MSEYNRFRTAIEIQDAGNMRAIARELVKAVDAAASEVNCTRAVYADPAVVLLIAKLQSLTASENFIDAYSACLRRASSQEKERS